MAFHDKLGRFAGGFADFLTGDRYDFDKMGKGNSPFAPRSKKTSDDDNEVSREGRLESFMEGLQSYNPERRAKSRADEFLDAMAERGFSAGSSGGFGKIGSNLFVMRPDNTARNQAIAMANQQAMMQQAQAKENRRMAGSALGTAVGSLFGPVGGAVGGFIGKLFCDIRLKEDIAPLCVSEVNDVLSECAFFVKDLNECS
jgi:hypothetical protein